MSADYFATLIVPCFNQEPYIRQSLESVLQQDCARSEILIGDDCSDDRTFEAVQEIVAGYQGRHVVKAHRNDRNLGSGNVLTLAGMASAQHVVVFHGDDVAMPDRATRLVETMKATGASLVCSNARLIDEAGEPYGHLIGDEPSGFLEIEQLAADWSRKQTGSSHAFDRRIVADFLGWAPDAYWFAGDHVLPFRAGLVGGAYYLDEALLDRRQHSENQGREVKAKLNSRLTPLMAKEISHARFLTTRAFMLRDLDAYAEKTGETDATRRGREALRCAIDEQLVAWSKCRARLLNEKYRPHWVSRDEYMSGIDGSQGRIAAAGRGKAPARQASAVLGRRVTDSLRRVLGSLRGR